MKKMIERQIEELKAKNVPDMMRNGDIEGLKKVMSEIDYSIFEKNSKPEVKFEEIRLETEDDARALTFYIWANPFVVGGDIYFWKNGFKFNRFLALRCGKWGEEMYDILNKSFVLSQKQWEFYKGLTLEQLLQPRMAA